MRNLTLPKNVSHLLLGKFSLAFDIYLLPKEKDTSLMQSFSFNAVIKISQGSREISVEKAFVK